MKLEEMKDKELWNEFKAYYQTVRIHKNYGVKDLMYLNASQHELEKRGYTIELFPFASHPEKESLDWIDNLIQNLIKIKKR